MKKLLFIPILMAQTICLGAASEKPPLNSDTTAMKEYIKNKFKTDRSCGAAITVSDTDETIDSIEQSVACLVTGARNIIWYSKEQFKEWYTERGISKEDFDIMNRLMETEGIKQVFGYMYRPEGKRNALLLAKRDIEEHENNTGINHYLKGLLLGYPKPDIAFYSQRSAFRRMDLPDKPKSIPMKYRLFSDSLKQRFQDFLKNEWPKSEAYQQFIHDTTEGDRWLKEQERYSDQELQDWLKEYADIPEDL